MINEWKQVLLFLPALALGLVLATWYPSTTPADSSTAKQTAATIQEQATAKVKVDTAKPAQENSVLDADVLDKPLSYFKNAFIPDEEDSSSDSDPSTIVMTVKALVATLLSTIM